MPANQKYEEMRRAGKSPREVYLISKTDGLGEIDAMRLLRDVFGLTIIEAKEVMTGGDPFARPQAIEPGATVYWEGADTIDGQWIMQARVKKIESGFAFVEDHRKYFVRPEGLVETDASGAPAQIPLAYFEKSLAQRLQESADFWGQLASLGKGGPAG